VPNLEKQLTKNLLVGMKVSQQICSLKKNKWQFKLPFTLILKIKIFDFPPLLKKPALIIRAGLFI